MAERLYTTYQIADLLDATPSTVVDWMQKGWLPFQRLPDGPVRISEHHLVAFLKNQGIDLDGIMAKAVMNEERSASASRTLETATNASSTRRQLLLDGPRGEQASVSETRDEVELSPAEPEEAEELAEPVEQARSEAPSLPMGAPLGPTPVITTAEASETPSPTDSTSQIVEAILQDAVARRSSCIHLEKLPGRFWLRLRIDGVLHEKASFNDRLPASATAGLMDAFGSLVEEAGEAGHKEFTRNYHDRSVRFRLSSLATAAGEKIVIRIAQPDLSPGALADLHPTAEQANFLRRLVRLPSGLVLLVGPPRAGRDALLWALAGQIHRAQRSVAIVARDSFAELDGITQCVGQDIAVAKIVSDLAAADTDVILVDEIDCPATFSACISAGRSNSVVIAPLACDSIAQGLAMIREVDTRPWPLATTLRAIVEVRTVRRLCDECKTSAAAEAELLERLGIDAEQLNDSVFESGRCDRCGRTGYLGLTALLSILAVDDSLAAALRRGADAAELLDHAGAKSMLQAAMDKVNAGDTALEELRRANL